MTRIHVSDPGLMGPIVFLLSLLCCSYFLREVFFVCLLLFFFQKKMVTNFVKCWFSVKLSRYVCASFPFDVLKGRIQNLIESVLVVAFPNDLLCLMILK